MGRSRTEEIVEAMARRVEAGQWPAGSQTPSLRAAAAEHGVAKNTMVEVYRRLVESGHLVARRGSGFFVAERRARPDRLLSEAAGAAVPLRGGPPKTPWQLPGGDEAPADWLADAALDRHLASLSVERWYSGGPAGCPVLRERIAERLAARAIRAGAPQILTTAGFDHGLDLIVRRYVAPGDSVLVDSPGHAPLFQALRLARAGVVGVRRGPQGPDLDDLAAKLAALGPRLFFTQTLAHDPLGSSATPETQHRLLGLAERHGLTLVELDPLAEILAPESPRLAAFDQLERVIQLGSFAPTLGAGFGLGYLTGRAEVVEELAALKGVTLGAGAGYLEALVAGTLCSEAYRAHCSRLAGRVAEAAKASVRALRQLGFTALVEPAGGFHLWCPLPDGLEESTVVRSAAAEAIPVAPGSAFTVPGDYRTGPALRINLGHAEAPGFLDFMGRLLRGELEPAT